MYDEKSGFYIRNLKIHYRNVPTLIIYLELIMVILYRALVSLGAPTGISYIIDVLNVYLLITLISSRSSRTKGILNNGRGMIWLLVSLWAITGTISALLYSINPALLLWSYRNNLRYLIFFGACCVYLTPKDVVTFLNTLAKLLPIHLILVLMQYFLFGIRGDFLGGIFGTTMGANLYVNAYIIVVFSYLLCLFMHKQINILKLSVAMLSFIIVATLSELKIVFVEILVIFALYVVVSQKDRKKILKYITVIIIGFVLISNALPVIYKLYPDFANFFSLEFIFAVHEQGYSMAGDLDRLSAIPSLYEMFFSHDAFKSLYGLGLGNAEYSSIAAFSSAFYSIYGYLHYIWFAYAMVYIETGFVGLALYCGVFVAIFVHSFKKNANESEPVNELAMILALMCFLLMIYNQTLRTEAAYLLYLVFSVTYIDDR